MNRARKGQLALVGLLAVMLAVSASAQGPDKKKSADKKKTPSSFEEAVAAESKLKRETVEKVLKALGPAVRAQLSSGKQVTLPGVGTFQVVRVSEYKDLAAGGRPIVVPSRNYVEFAAAGEMEAASNAPGAVPARTVEGYDFRVIPNANPGLRTEGRRTLGTRTR